MTPPEAWAEWVDRFAAATHGTISARTGLPISASTINQHRYWLDRFAGRLDVDPWHVTPEMVACWITAPGGPSTVRGRRGALRAFYGWAVREGHLEEPPLEVPAVELDSALGSGWDEAIESFADHLAKLPAEKRPSGALRCAHATNLVALARAARCGPWALDPDEMARWVEGDDEVSRHTRSRRRRTLLAFYAWAVETGRILRSPIDLPAAPIGSDWKSAIDGFARHAAERGDVTPATAESYVRHVGWLAQGVDEGPWGLEARHVETWLEGRSWSLETRRKVLVSLRAFYTWGCTEALVQWSPVAGLHSKQTLGDVRWGRDLTAEWREPVEAFLTTMRASSRGDGTIKLRREHLCNLASSASDPWAVTTTHLREWLANPGWSPATRRSRRSTVRNFYKWAVLEGHLDVSPAERLESVLVPRSMPRPIADEPLFEAIHAADHRVRLMLMLGTFAGLRRGEIARARFDDMSERSIRVRGKGGHVRVVDMHPLLWEAITAERSRRAHGRTSLRDGVGGAEWLFPSDRRPGPLGPASVGYLTRQVLPQPWTLHQLRHRFAGLAYAAQRDLFATQELLGHARPETTSVYARVPDGATRTAVMNVSMPSAPWAAGNRPTAG